MDIETIVLGLLNVALGGGMFFMKAAYIDLKDRVLKLEDTAMKRDDFKEFKQELFARLDKLELEIKK